MSGSLPERLFFPLTIAFFILAAGAQSQRAHPRFDHFSVEHGLSHFCPTCITQDARGFLWVGTEDGLNRYDGYTFRVYRPIPGDGTSVSSSNISALATDASGHLWIGTGDDGLNRYDPSTDSYRRYMHAAGVAGTISGDAIRSFLRDRNGNFWIGTSNGLNRYDPDHDAFEQVRGSEGMNVMAMTQAYDGTLWLATDRGVLHISPATRSVIKQYDLRIPRKSPEYNLLMAVAFDGRGDLWVAGIRGIMQYDPQKDTFAVSHRMRSKNLDVSADVVFSLRTDSHGTLWIGTFHLGLWRFDPWSGAIDVCTNTPGDPNALDKERVSCLFEDDAGILWAGTYRGGLNRYDPRKDFFRVFRSEYPVYAILRTTRGEVLAGSLEAGMLVVDSVKSRLQKVEPRTLLGRTFANLTILSMKEDPDGTLWIGTGVGLARVDRRRTSVTWYVPEKTGGGSPDMKEIKSILFDRDGGLWIGSNGAGLGRYDRAHDTFTWYRSSSTDTTTLGGDNVWGLAQDTRGLLWVATLGGGVSSFDTKRNIITRYRHDSRNPGSLASDGVYSVAEDERGSIWAGTFGAGVNEIESKSGRRVHLNDRDGLPNNFVKGIVPDGKGALWLSTDQGLARITLDSLTCRIFREEDGVHNNVFLSGAYLRDATGRMYFGGEGGITEFHPDSLRRNMHPPHIAITSMTVAEKLVRYDESGSGMPSVTLGYDQNYFAFDFVALDFTAPEHNTCRYMLEGLDNDWVNSGSRRYARYTHVPPGEYVFSVSGANGDGIWSRDVASVRVVIKPPYWATWWFRAAMIACLAVLATLAYNYRVNRLLELERLRVRIASDLHDDIGSSLTRISLQSELVREGIDPASMNDYLANIAATSRELVVTMSDIVWSIDARNDTIGNLISKMRDFATATLGAKQIDCTFTHRGLDDARKIPVTLRENIYLIFKEAVNNIAKHSGATAASIALENGRENFTMTIADNGPGSSALERGSGHGMKNMKMRAGRIKGRLSVELADGARIVLTLARI